MKRRTFLAAPAALAGGALWAHFGEVNWFDLTHTQIHIPGARPTRLLHVSDFHVSDGMTAPELAVGLELGLRTKPDLICLTGDYVSTTQGFDRPGLGDLLKRCAATAPTFTTLGNHDGGWWLRLLGGDSHTELVREILDHSGVQILHNRATSFRGLNLVGLGDLWSGEFHPDRVNWPDGPTVLLSHNPDSKDILFDYPWQLMLSGHTHGGQGRLPFITPTWAPVRDHRYIDGLYKWQDRQLFITRGIGSPHHVRALCRPEISLLEIAS